ncbi:MAG: radical SAM protein [bacterium]
MRPKSAAQPGKNFDPAPPELLLRITFACNQACIFCNTYHMKKNNDTCRDVLVACKNATGTGMIPLFTGGEPTIHRDIIKMIHIARETGHRRVGIQTNAVLMADESFAGKLRKAGLTFAILSLHSHDENTSDAITGAPGTFARTMRGISNLISEGVDIIINHVLCSVNYRDAERFIDFVNETIIEKMGCHATEEYGFLSLSFVQPMGRAHGAKDVVPKLSEAGPFFAAALRRANELGITITNPGCGVPVCFTPGLEAYSSEYHLLLRRMYDVGTFRVNMTRKVKSKQCAGCAYDRLCLGVWESYSEMYGLDELTPIEK